MLLTVSEIPEEGLHQDIELPVKLDEDASADVAHAVLDISRLGAKVLVNGTVTVQLTSRCGRCLKEFPYPVEAVFSEEYDPYVETGIEGEGETAVVPDLSFYVDDEIDIDELIKEQVLLSVPMKPLCSPECRGICPKCGKDLNEGTCGCETKGTDPRLAPLEKLREAMKGRGKS
ncbi:MAG: DUF177 domain-containing protein [Nitrospirota bacterium]|nr:DUF177 domain-containing protein [Nitrospirota bacterium]